MTDWVVVAVGLLIVNVVWLHLRVGHLERTLVNILEQTLHETEQLERIVVEGIRKGGRS